MKDYLEQCINKILRDLPGAPEDFTVELEAPNNPDHGDLATNAAMKLARYLKKAPRQIAEDLVARLRDLPIDSARIAEIEIAGAGFINFRFAGAYLADTLTAIIEAGDSYGRTSIGTGKKVMVEFVSANPTGPLTVGHGRNAVLGDTLANLYEWTGHEVTREYYFNDAGRQMRILGLSVAARYKALVDPTEPTKTIDSDGDALVVPASFPEDGYLGDYITEIARDVRDSQGADLTPSDPAPFKEAAEKAIFADIERTLARLRIHMNAFFNERTLYDSGKVWEVVEKLRDLDYVYDSEGAVWFKTTALGKDKDTVLVKGTGEPTYRLPDIAYHVDKLERGFDRVIDVFGADHIATYPDVLSAVSLLGFDAEKIDVVIYQFVTLVRGGEPVKMSTRKATYVTLDDLMDEVGEDVTRFFFLMRSPNTHLAFDLDLAKEASEKNPVFYLQYAHARICSIVRKAEEVGFTFDASTDLSLLQHEAEDALAKELMRFPGAIVEAANAEEPHRIANYLRDVAVAFTQFYGNCRIIGEARELASARMALALATRTVLRNGLAVLGITAPQEM